MRLTVIKRHEGPYALNYQTLELVLCEVEGGGTRGLRREKEGWSEAEAELLLKVPTHADALNVSADLATKITTLTQRLAEVRALKVQAQKLASVAAQTEVILEDEREGLVKLVADAARKTSARKNPELKVAFEKTISYHGQRGKKAAKTRQKNEEAAAQASSGGGADTQAPAAAADPSSQPR